METLIEILKWNPADTFRDFIYGTPILGPIVGAICIFLALFFLFLVIHEMSIQSIIQDRKRREQEYRSKSEEKE